MYEDIEAQQQAEAYFEDVIERAYLEELIDGNQQFLAFLWLRTNLDYKEH